MMSTKGMLFGALVVVPVLVTGCAPAERISLQFEAQPIQTLPVATGRLVTLPGSETENQKEITRLEKWAASAGAEVRVVDRNTGVVEVFGASQDEVQAVLPESTVTENKYLPNLIRGQESMADVYDAVVPARIQCTSMDESLKLRVGMTRATAGLFNRNIARLGAGQLTFGASEENRVELTFGWIVSGPEDSTFKRYGVVSNRLDLTPDVPGLYQMMLIGSRGDGRCQAARVAFGVTTTDTFRGATPARAFNPAQDRAQFRHLGVVNAEEAWARTKGRGVKIAVIDTGVNFNHPDLSQNIGLKDGKILGHNFWEGTAIPFDDQGHGTHVSGLAASAVMGIAPEATIIPIKAMNAAGGGDVAAIVAAIRFAGNAGADVINASLGSEDESFKVLEEAIRDANAKGALFIAAAGNGDADGKGIDVDSYDVYPATFNLPGLLAVAATRLDGMLSSYSNFGLRRVHVAAPGGENEEAVGGPLQSAHYLPNKRLYQGMAGTSMASPVTAGIAALVKAMHPNYTPAQLKEHLIRSGTDAPGLAGKVVSGRLLNAQVAVVEL